jgi:hypothetical protein
MFSSLVQTPADRGGRATGDPGNLAGRLILEVVENNHKLISRFEPPDRLMKFCISFDLLKLRARSRLRDKPSSHESVGVVLQILNQPLASASAKIVHHAVGRDPVSPA